MVNRDPHGERVAEGCAEALLAACAQVLALRDPTSTERTSIHDAHALALNMLDRVIVRTMAEEAGRFLDTGEFPPDQ